MKTKPMYMFMNMLFQRTITPISREPSPTAPNFRPREDPHLDHDHDHDHEDHQYVHFETVAGAEKT
jgi:hypothetical protein